MKGNNPLFGNSGNKSKTFSKYSNNSGVLKEKESYANQKGLQLLRRAKSNDTKNFIKQNYRSSAKEGDGSTAAAARKELKMGVLVGGKHHVIKAQQEIRRIDNILKKNPNHVDRKILLSERRKLVRALKTKNGGKK